MVKVKVKKSFSHQLLQACLIGGAVVIAATNPYFGLKIIGEFNKELKRKKWRDVQRSLYYFKRQGLADVSQNPDGSYTVTVTHVGKKYVSKYELEKIKVEALTEWDGIWRVCLFDIPAKKKENRYVLLNKLKELGFVMMQKSVWVHPFPCREELAVLTRAYEIEPYVNFHEAYDLSHEVRIKREFEKRNGIVLRK